MEFFGQPPSTHWSLPEDISKLLFQMEKSIEKKDPPIGRVLDTSMNSGNQVTEVGNHYPAQAAGTTLKLQRSDAGPDC